MGMVTFSALAEPNRLHMVEMLLHGPMTVGDIANQLEIRQPQASKHLKVLLDAGLVEVKAEANRRNYQLRMEPFQEMDSWLSSYRRIWSERYDNLDAYLEKLQAYPNQDPTNRMKEE
ncbi:ArsR/SmtB family transcription factor [Peribacillus sp. NPDC056705]|uniref:ArsR/SmtB family transcription factor n=1 Tax=Peribacillus sp. NPDC056705 TaxID=3345918 RepID=UPI0037479E14